MAARCNIDVVFIEHRRGEQTAARARGRRSTSDSLGLMSNSQIGSPVSASNDRTQPSPLRRDNLRPTGRSPPRAGWRTGHRGDSLRGSCPSRRFPRVSLSEADQAGRVGSGNFRPRPSHAVARDDVDEILDSRRESMCGRDPYPCRGGGRPVRRSCRASTPSSARPRARLSGPMSRQTTSPRFVVNHSRSPSTSGEQAMLE